MARTLYPVSSSDQHITSLAAKQSNSDIAVLYFSAYSGSRLIELNDGVEVRMLLCASVRCEAPSVRSLQNEAYHSNGTHGDPSQQLGSSLLTHLPARSPRCGSGISNAMYADPIPPSSSHWNIFETSVMRKQASQGHRSASVPNILLSTAQTLAGPHPALPCQCHGTS